MQSLLPSRHTPWPQVLLCCGRSSTGHRSQISFWVMLSIQEPGRCSQLHATQDTLGASNAQPLAPDPTLWYPEPGLSPNMHWDAACELVMMMPQPSRHLQSPGAMMLSAAAVCGH